MAAEAKLIYQGQGSGKLTLWLTDTDGLFPVGESVGGGSVFYFEDDDTGAFVGIEVNYADAVEEYADTLRALPFPHVDVVQAQLVDVHPAEALLWASRNLHLMQDISAIGDADVC